MPNHNKVVTLRDPKKVRSWAEEHQAQPALLQHAGGAESLVFQVAGSYPEAKPLSFDEFLRRFENQGLSLAVQKNSGHWQFHDDQKSGPGGTILGNEKADQMRPQR